MSNKLSLFVVHSSEEGLPVPRYFENDRWALLSQWIWVGLVSFGVLLLTGAATVATAGMFLSERNLISLMNQGLALFLLVPMAALLFSRGQFDLSVGYVAGLAAYVFVLDSGLSVVPALLVGGLFGLLNGVFAGILRFPSLLVTVVTAALARSVVLLLSGPQGTVVVSGNTDFVPVLGWICLVALIAGAVVLSLVRRTDFVARALPFVLSSLAASMAGLYLAHRMGSASFNLGYGYELDLLLAVVSGGLWLAGHRPNLAGALVASLGVVLFNNAVYLLNLDLGWSLGTKMVLILGNLLALWGYHALVGWNYRRSLVPVEKG